MQHEIIGGQVRLGKGKLLPLSKAIRAGDFVFFSGQLGINDEGQLVGATVADQTRQCLENIKTQLALVKLDLSQIVRTTVWLTSTSYFADFNWIYAEYFATNPPVRSTVCSKLMLPGALVEIEVTAYAPKS